MFFTCAIPFRRDVPPLVRIGARSKALRKVIDVLAERIPRQKSAIKVAEVLAFEHGIYDNFKGIFCSVARLAKRTKCTERTVARALNTLEAEGFLFRVNRGYKKTNMYFLNYGVPLFPASVRDKGAALRMHVFLYNKAKEGRQSDVYINPMIDRKVEWNY